MSRRRKIDDVVLLEADDEGEYLARIVATEDHRSPDSCIYKCGDKDCKEWPVLEVLDSEGKPTGERIFHVAECDMRDSPAQPK